MRRVDTIIYTSSALFLGLLGTGVLVEVHAWPIEQALIRVGCILTAFIGVVAYTHKLNVIRDRHVSEEIKQAVTAAVESQAQQLGAAIAEEMKLYGDARAIDAHISNEVRNAARHRAEEQTLDLESLRLPKAVNQRAEQARAIPLATVTQLHNRK